MSESEPFPFGGGCAAINDEHPYYIFTLERTWDDDPMLNITLKNGNGWFYTDYSWMFSEWRRIDHILGGENYRAHSSYNETDPTPEPEPEPVP